MGNSPFPDFHVFDLSAQSSQLSLSRYAHQLDRLDPIFLHSYFLLYVLRVLRLSNSDCDISTAHLILSSSSPFQWDCLEISNSFLPELAHLLRIDSLDLVVVLEILEVSCELLVEVNELAHLQVQEAMMTRL